MGYAMHNQYHFLESCWSEFKQKFPTIYMFDWLIWPPSQGINFLYVPSKYRYHILTPYFQI